MQHYGIFDIIGPIMIGPSSSHTAGAVRLGFIADRIFKKDIIKVEFGLHGSFYKTHQGHGTDRALLAGVMGLRPDDDRLRDSFDIAEKRGIEYHFSHLDLGNVHPNSVVILMYSSDGTSERVVGSSVGGGKIQITQIGDIQVEINGEYPTLITRHTDRPGIIAKVSTILNTYNINIAFMKLFRQSKGAYASLVVQMDQDIKMDVLQEISEIDQVQSVRFIESLEVKDHDND